MKLLTAQLWEVHYKEVFCRNPLQTFSKCIQWALLHLKRARDFSSFDRDTSLYNSTLNKEK